MFIKTHTELSTNMPRQNVKKCSFLDSALQNSIESTICLIGFYILSILLVTSCHIFVKHGVPVPPFIIYIDCLTNYEGC